MKHDTAAEPVVQSLTTKRVVSFRLDTNEFEEWRETARLDGRTLSNWIVTKCRVAVGMPGPLPTPDLKKISKGVAVDSKPRVRVRREAKTPLAVDPVITGPVVDVTLDFDAPTKRKQRCTYNYTYI